MTTSTPDELGFDEAEGVVVEQRRKERAAKIAELRRQADGARERAAKAQARFERAVALNASTRPEREDWYEHPGDPLGRKALLAAANLSTLQLHRIMERYRKNGGAKKGGRRRG